MKYFYNEFADAPAPRKWADILWRLQTRQAGLADTALNPISVYLNRSRYRGRYSAFPVSASSRRPSWAWMYQGSSTAPEPAVREAADPDTEV